MKQTRNIQADKYDLTTYFYEANTQRSSEILSLEKKNILYFFNFPFRLTVTLYIISRIQHTSFFKHHLKEIIRNVTAKIKFINPVIFVVPSSFSKNVTYHYSMLSRMFNNN